MALERAASAQSDAHLARRPSDGCACTTPDRGFVVLESIIMNTRILATAIIISIALITVGYLTRGHATPIGETLTVYKSPQCGCCVQYIAYLRKEGFDVVVETTDDMQSIKDRYDIPYDTQSCHTTVTADGRFIEGHMPVEVVRRFLGEDSSISGITLPGMPAGSPGMPGLKAGPFEIFALSNGVVSEYVAH